MKNYSKFIKSTLENLIHEVAQHPELICCNPGHDFTRNRKLPLEKVISILIGIGGDPLRNELLKYFHYSTEMASVPAFVQQRSKLLPSALETLFSEFAAACDEGKRYMGYRLLAVDGSDLQFPTNPKDKDSYIPASEKKSHFNIIHLNALFDIVSGTYLDAIVQKTRMVNESAALTEMVNRSNLTAPVIVTADRGYETYNCFASIQEKGWSFLIRAREKQGIFSKIPVPDTDEYDVSLTINISRRKTALFKRLMQEDPRCYRLIPASKRFDFLPPGSNELYQLPLRIVRFALSPNSFETVITNLDAKNFPANKLRKLYFMRWGIETAFRQLKQTIGLRMFQCKKVEHVIQEVFARLIMYNFTELITSHIVIPVSSRKYAYQANFSAAVHICRLFLRGEMSPPKLKSLIQMFLTPIRPGRSEQRKVTRIRFTGFYYRIA